MLTICPSEEENTMTPAYFHELYDYNFWNNRRVWNCVTALSHEQITQPNAYSQGAILTQCFHVMSVEWWWIRFLREGTLDFLGPEAYLKPADVRQKWDETESYVRVYLEELAADDLQREVKPDFWDEDEASVKVYQALTQVAFHSADHRSQILAQVDALGGETVGQDFLDYLEERA